MTRRDAVALALAGSLSMLGCGTRTPAELPSAVTRDAGSMDARPDAPPAPERCNGIDDDGDGEIDEVCSCVVGAVEPCFGGPRTTIGVGLCREGQRRCAGAGAGAAWSGCEGAILPSAELCEDGLDQDCDGTDALCPTFEQTETFVVGEGAVLRPLDVVWVVDQSLSMVQEIANVRANINRFVDTIDSAGIDYRVVFVAERAPFVVGGASLCVPPPLAGPDCADAERFRQIDRHVESNNALTLIREHIDEIEAFMQPGSRRVFVVVTDDESEIGADEFDAWVRARPGYDDYVVDAIVGIDAAVCPAIIAVGATYLRLAALTDGETEHICATDWSVTFERFAEAIAGLDQVYPLDLVPLPGTIRVRWDGVEQPEGIAWSYDAARNAIVLVDAVAPPLGTPIEVVYRAAR